MTGIGRRALIRPHRSATRVPIGRMRSASARSISCSQHSSTSALRGSRGLDPFPDLAGHEHAQVQAGILDSCTPAGHPRITPGALAHLGDDVRVDERHRIFRLFRKTSARLRGSAITRCINGTNPSMQASKTVALPSQVRSNSTQSQLSRLRYAYGSEPPSRHRFIRNPFAGAVTVRTTTLQADRSRAVPGDAACPTATSPDHQTDTQGRVDDHTPIPHAHQARDRGTTSGCLARPSPKGT